MLLALAMLALIPGPDDDDPRRMLEGVALIAGTDRPAAGVTLYLFDRDQRANRVVTDQKGRFRLALRDGMGIPEQDTDDWPPCWLKAEQMGRWSFDGTSDAPFASDDPEWLRKLVTEAMTRQVKTRCLGRTIRVEIPEQSEVEVLVRGPEGLPVCDKTIQVRPIHGIYAGQVPAGLRLNGRTDATGRFRVRWFPGLYSFRVSVPGVGFGATPLVDLNEADIKTETLPLARFGAIEGRVAARFIVPGRTVTLDRESCAPAACDQAGRFAIRDVPPGINTLHLGGPELAEGSRSSTVTVCVTPGKTLEGVVIDEAPPLTPAEEEQARRVEAMDRHERHARDGAELWVEGTIRDRSGRPLANVDVIGSTSYQGAMRMYKDLRATTTDKDGYYAISGPIRESSSPLIVVAKVKGRPLSCGIVNCRTLEDDRVAKLDLTLADAGGSASVTVLEDGKPVVGAAVELEPESGSDPRFGPGSPWSGRLGSDEAFRQIESKEATTDRDGVARLAGLLPGRYTIRAKFIKPAELARPDVTRSQMKASTGESHGVAIVEGRETKASVTVAEIGRTVRFQVIRPDGRALIDQAVGFEFHLADGSGFGTVLHLDKAGSGSYPCEATGLLTIAADFLDTRTSSYSSPMPEPYYRATTLVPLSPACPIREPIQMVGRLRKPGSLLVRLLDSEGRPVRGVVAFDSRLSQDCQAATTDERGEVRFTGLISGTKYLRGHLPDLAPPPWSESGPGIDERTLRGRFELVPMTEVKITADRETVLELRASRLGYLKGSFKLPAGRDVFEYTIDTMRDERILETNGRVDPVSRRYLAGPFPAGPTTLQFSRIMPDGATRECGTQVVEVAAGEVTEAELRPVEPDPKGRWDLKMRALLGMDSGAEQASWTVFLPDGITPAYAAQAAVFEPGEDDPVAEGISDASGRLTWRLIGGLKLEDADRSRRVREPTLVVSLPGRHGAAIVPLEAGRSRRVTLPTAIGASGQVKLDGPKPVSGSRIGVIAASRGRGVLDQAVSLEVTPDPDGRFTLEGLTPGRYLVQAARDGIWVSKSVDLTIESGKIPPPIDLEIPAPGEPLTLEFVDATGRPFADREFKLNRPEGPFAALWPQELRTDAMGRMTLWSLETGPHSARIEGSSDPVEFEIRGRTAETIANPLKRIILKRSEP